MSCVSPQSARKPAVKTFDKNIANNLDDIPIPA
jgi:hypothetical protein